MSEIKLLREQLGLSQGEFADLLQTERAQVSMKESGLRVLPPAARRLAAHMQKILDDEPALSNFQLAENIGGKDLFKKHLRSSQLKLERLELQGEKVEIKKLQADRYLAVATTLNQLNLAEDETTLLKLHLMQRKAVEKQKKYSGMWWLIQLKIAGLQAVIARCESALLS